MTKYCICKKTYNGEAMIACDFCNEWYHPECINISEESLKILENNRFMCFGCQENPKLKQKKQELHDEMSKKGLNPDTVFRQKTSVEQHSESGIAKSESRAQYDNSDDNLTPELKEKREKICQLFLQIFQDNMDDFNSPDVSSMENSESYSSPAELARDIERSLFSAFSQTDANNVVSLDKRCTQKVYSLTFNMKKNKVLRQGLVSRHIPVDKFVRMTPDELADKQLAEWRDVARQKSISRVLLPESLDIMTIKKGRDANDPLYDDPQHVISSVPTISATTLLPPDTPPASISEPYELVQEEDNITIDSSVSSVSKNELVASLMNDASDWNGVISFTGVGEFYAIARKLTPIDGHLSSIFPPLVGIQGRIEQRKADDFLTSLKSSSSKELTYCGFFVDQQDADTRHTFFKIHDYFLSRHRYAVISDKTLIEYVAVSRALQPSTRYPNPVADLYLIPVKKGDDLSSLPFVSKNMAKLLSTPEEDFFLATLIVTKTSRNGSH